ncbi:MAG: hypothetical protein JRI23_19260 [Deltaproteobacteria bacterium]|nr:hypothetical protein [Deltaproteobacteria bacterium]MBW2534004.1 hypothetical protein [Deltaproteobacteria bacterium]
MTTRTTLCIASLLAALAAQGCAVEPAPDGDRVKDEVTEIPFAGDFDGKADSPWFPRDGGTLLVGEQEVADFDGWYGWIGYEMELSGGTVDIDVAEHEAGSDSKLDTILVVYGPERSNGRYPIRPVAFNDDWVPGENLNSHIVFDVPEAGRYRIVVSTYLNWLNYPFNVSEGTYALIVKCQDGAEACGPAWQP